MELTVNRYLAITVILIGIGILLAGWGIDAAIPEPANAQIIRQCNYGCTTNALHTEGFRECFSKCIALCS